MNYIGSKLTLLPFLEQIYREISDGTERTFCDMFAGTGAVGRHFQKLGLNIIANDLQYYAYVLNKAYLEIKHTPTFDNLQTRFASEIAVYKSLFSDPVSEVLSFINNLTGTLGFITQNYSPLANRNYYTVENSTKVDAIRQALEHWRAAELLNDTEYFYLLCSLLEAIDQVANTACVYEAFLKNFKKTATKPLTLQPLSLSPIATDCQVFKEDANQLIQHIECDILYLDPPYNERQYGSNYHLLETIAAYDQPVIRGITGMRQDYQRSSYCSKRQVLTAFKELIVPARAKHILVSYNDEGLMNLTAVQDILSLRGTPKLFQTPYHRFKADNNRQYQRHQTTEYLHYVKVIR
jgi:adenine-specific DNA-methyltransferase